MEEGNGLVDGPTKEVIQEYNCTWEYNAGCTQSVCDFVSLKLKHNPFNWKGTDYIHRKVTLLNSMCVHSLTNVCHRVQKLGLLPTCFLEQIPKGIFRLGMRIMNHVNGLSYLD